jgi:Arc/MetJ-type ribon-helix-helix transcriptional regulator
MDPVQIRLTKELIEKIDNMIESGLYPNRSEAVRDAVRRLRIIKIE